MSKPRLILAAAIATFLLLTLLDRFKVIELLALRAALPLALASIEAVAVVGAGFAVRGLRGRVWRVHEESGALDLPLDFILGYPIFGTLCFLIATMRIATWTMLPLLAIGAIFGLYAIARWREGVRQAPSPVEAPPPVKAPSPAEADSRGRLSYTVIALVFLCAFIAALAPPFSLDELAYHLAVPKVWLLEGRAIALPLLSHSYFPLGIESADLPFLTLLGDEGGIASHFLHLFAAIATTMLIQRRAKNLLITAAIVTTPALAITAGWSLVDFPLLGICVALWLALEQDDDTTAAAAIGAGLLTKYTFIPFALVALIAARRWRPALPGLLIGSVFFIRNLLIAGNPIAPFLAAGAPHVANYRGGAYLADYVFDPKFLDESLGASMLTLAPLAGGVIPFALLAAGIALFVLAPSARLLIPFFAVPAMSATTERRWIRWFLSIAIAVQTLLVVYMTMQSDAFSLLGTGRNQTQRGRPGSQSLVT